jgi:ABC-type glycerol-3-phosphate transport system permease component
MRKNYGFGEKLFQTIDVILLVLFAMLCAYPIYFFLINSISSPAEINLGVYLWPREITFFNYTELFKDPMILRASMISVARTVLGTSLTCLACSFLAYLFTKQDLPARKFLYRAVVITMYLNAGMIPWYIVMKAYGFKNNFLLYIVPYLVFPFYVILIKTYIESISKALEESAMIDGAGTIRIFVSIIFPLCIPVLASVAVFSAIMQWNMWYDNFMLCPDQSLKTLQLLLYDYIRKFNASMMSMTSVAGSAGNFQTLQATPFSVRITITMITMFPIMLVYPLLQRYFIKGIMLGAVKG